MLKCCPPSDVNKQELLFDLPVLAGCPAHILTVGSMNETFVDTLGHTGCGSLE